MANAQIEFKRGMLIAYNVVKDGKKHTLKSIRSAFAKEKIRKGVIGRMYRLGRYGRALKQFDIVIDLGEAGEMSESATFQMVKGAFAKKQIAEKTARYKGLAGMHSAPKKSTKAKAKKTAKRKVVKRKPVHAGGSTASSEDDNSALES